MHPAAQSSPPETTASTCLYEQVANELAADIEQLIYRPGQKVPSVRKLSQSRGVSISTVSQAYALLEDRGLIHAKPQSGYFVRFGMTQTNERPPVSVGINPTNVTKADLIQEMLSNAQKPSAVNLGVAIPDNELLPHRALQNHLQKAARFQIKEAISYQFTPGYEPLRVQIAQRMRGLDVRCHPDEMVITQGCTEAISLCLRASTCAGDTIAVESPCYYGFLQIAESLGLKVIEIPTDPDTGMSVEALQLALQQWSIKLVLLVTRFSNPTGCSLSSEKQQQLVALLNQYDICAIEDDIYGELSFDSRKQSVLKTFDRQGRVMYCSSYSKTIAPGLRTGWCIPGRRLETVKKLQMFNALSGTSLTQCALASYLQHGHYDKHLRNLRRVTQLSMRNIRAAVDTHFPAETLTSNPRGGSVLWVHLPKQVNARQLKAMAEAQGVSVMPGDIFSNTDHFANAIRLNCSMTWSQAIEQGLQTLGQLACRLSPTRSVKTNSL